ncbi:hypothetical protein [Streptomyces sp. NPDC059513]|uniref:hypothetical protein n=1 Tax=unclassified Streptomyces TaxID=2593676 RepID=UPI0036749530
MIAVKLKDDAASLLTPQFFKSKPSEFDLAERILTSQSLEEIDEMSMSEFRTAVEWLDLQVKSLKGARHTDILILVNLIDEHEEALAYDCIALGLRLRDVGSEDFTWGDLWTIVLQSPRSSALYRAMNPDEYAWGIEEQLLAAAVDALNVANWQRGQGKKKDFPAPIPRPGVEAPDNKFGKEALPMDEMTDWLGW